MTSTLNSLPPDSAFGISTALEPALLAEVSSIFKQIGVQSFRASVVDVVSMAAKFKWTINETGAVSDGGFDVSVDSAFLGASAAVNKLAKVEFGKTVTHRLSPRLWGFAWRIGAMQAVVAEVYFHERRDAVVDIDVSLVRLVGSLGMRTSVNGAGDEVPATHTLAWPQKERRSKSLRSLANPWPARTALALVVAGALLSGWLAVFALPKQHQLGQSANLVHQSEQVQLKAMAEKTMSQQLSVAVATGDYGEVQNLLSSFSALGYFSGAIIVNSKQVVVAKAGDVGSLRIGDPLEADVTQNAKLLELALGSQRQGQLVVMQAPAAHKSLEGAANSATMLGPLIAAWLAFALASGAAVMLALRLRQGQIKRAK
jgi:hypothetical protein